MSDLSVRAKVGLAIVAVLAVAGLLSLTDAGTTRLGDERDIRVLLLGGPLEGERGRALVGVTPLSVRQGSEADLAGFQHSTDQGRLDMPAGTPHFVEVKVVNKGEVTVGPSVKLFATGSRGTELTELSAVHRDNSLQKFTICAKASSESDTLRPGDSAVSCHLLIVPPGEKLARLRVADESWQVD